MSCSMRSALAATLFFDEWELHRIVYSEVLNYADNIGNDLNYVLASAHVSVGSSLDSVWAIFTIT